MQAAAIAAIAAAEMIAAEITIFCSPFHTFWQFFVFPLSTPIQYRQKTKKC